MFNITTMNTVTSEEQLNDVLRSSSQNDSISVQADVLKNLLHELWSLREELRVRDFNS